MISYIDGGKDTKKISNNQERKTRIWYFFQMRAPFLGSDPNPSGGTAYRT
jgi:hypothetical protein